MDAAPPAEEAALPEPRNYVPGTDVWVPSGKHERARANLAALHVLNRLDQEERYATAEEQDVIAHWSGWGAIPEVFDPQREDFAAERAQLEEYLDSREWNLARSTVLNAHYTDPAIAAETWRLLERAGFAGGRVLEPGAGSGTFIGHAPPDAEMIGVELDGMTARVAAALYPAAQIRHESFADTAVIDNAFTASVGNVPFGNYRLLDSDHNAQHFSIHNHFILKSLDLTAPGGYVALLTSRYTADSLQTRARQAMADRADLITAARFPEGTMRRVAGTDVVTDLLVFRVREPSQPPSDTTKDFVATTDVELWNREGDRSAHLAINSFFANRPENVFGAMSIGSNQFGADELRVAPSGDLSDLAPTMRDVLGRDIDAAVASGLGLDASGSLAYDSGLESTGFQRPKPAAPEAAPGALRYNPQNDSIEQYFSGQWAEAKVPKSRKAEWVEIIGMRDTALALIDAQKEGASAETKNSLRTDLGERYDAYVARYGFLNRFTLREATYPTEQQHAERLDKALDQWLKDNGPRMALESVDEIPEDVRERLSDDAWRPVRSEFKQQKHLSGPMRDDPHLPVVLSLEKFDEDSHIGRKAALFYTDVLAPARPVEKVSSIEDAFAVSLDEGASVDLDRIAQLLDTDTEAVQQQIEERGLAFRAVADPHTWIPRTRYLSGNVREKLDQAETAARTDSRYIPNVRHLREVQPARIEDGISVTPGVTWIGAEDYKQFLVDTFGVHEDSIAVTRHEGVWTVDAPTAYNGFRQHALDYGLVPRKGTEGRTGFNFVGNDFEQELTNQGVSAGRDRSGITSHWEVFSKLLNSEEMAVNRNKEYKEKKPDGTLTHPAATRALQQKAKALEERFAHWALDEDPDRRERLITEYNRRFNATVAPKYDGSHRTFPGLGTNFVPYSYQRNAVERIVNEPTVLLNHVVGAGKSGTMFMGAMELKRLGLARQPWLVAPNHLVGQITAEAKLWYPGANILSGAGRTNAEDRRLLVAQSAAQDWDLVVVPMSTFSRINVSPEARAKALDDHLAQLRQSLESARDDGAKLTVKKIEAALKKAEASRAKALDEATKDDGLRFEQSGADYLLIDEAHTAKNLARQSNVEGLSHPGSDLALDVHLKLGVLRERKRQEAEAAGIPADAYVERVATFATGTPVANSLAEFWVMQTYLAPELLDHAGVSHINEWAAAFTRTESTVEINAAGTKLRPVERVSKFANVAELVALNATFIDRVGREDVEAELSNNAAGLSLPQKVGGKEAASGNIVIDFEPDQESRDFIQDLGYRVDTLDPRRMDLDNSLKIANDGRNVSLDPRAAHLPAPADGGRARHVANNVLEQWRADAETVYTDPATGEPSSTRGGLQIIFCDRSTPKNDGRWNMYEGIRQELISGGMPAHQIAFIHDFPKPQEKQDLFARCRDGRISVLLGSTEKMGTGTNVQDRAIALHHVDVPWRPADLEQREGRIVRQGNQNAEVRVFNYVGRGTYDTAMWQTLNRKAEFLAQIARADTRLREIEDIGADDLAASTAYTKALATGDTRYLREIELAQDVEEMEAEYNSHMAGIRSRQSEEKQLSGLIPRQHASAAQLAQAAGPIADWMNAESKTWTIGDHSYTARKEASPALLNSVRRCFHDLQGRGAQVTQPVATIAGHQLVARLFMETGTLNLEFPEFSQLGAIVLEPKDVGLGANRANDKTTAADASVAGGIMTRVENTLKSVEKHRVRLEQEIATNEFRLDQLRGLKSEPFERLAEMKAAQSELANIREQLENLENSDAVAQAREERLERMASKGRDEGYSLMLNPTPALLDELGFDTAEELRAEMADRERQAQIAQGIDPNAGPETTTDESLQLDTPDPVIAALANSDDLTVVASDGHETVHIRDARAEITEELSWSRLSDAIDHAHQAGRPPEQAIADVLQAYRLCDLLEETLGYEVSMRDTASRGTVDIYVPDEKYTVTASLTELPWTGDPAADTRELDAKITDAIDKETGTTLGQRLDPNFEGPALTDMSYGHSLNTQLNNGTHDPGVKGPADHPGPGRTNGTDSEYGLDSE